MKPDQERPYQRETTYQLVRLAQKCRHGTMNNDGLLIHAISKLDSDSSAAHVSFATAILWSILGSVDLSDIAVDSDGIKAKFCPNERPSVYANATGPRWTEILIRFESPE